MGLSVTIKKIKKIEGTEGLGLIPPSSRVLEF